MESRLISSWNSGDYHDHKWNDPSMEITGWSSCKPLLPWLPANLFLTHKPPCITEPSLAINTTSFASPTMDLDLILGTGHLALDLNRNTRGSILMRYSRYANKLLYITNIYSIIVWGRSNMQSLVAKKAIHPNKLT